MQWLSLGREHDVDVVRALARSPECNGVLLVGRAGIGKSTLSRQLVKSIGGGREGKCWLAATSATQGIPFGAFAHLLPEEFPKVSDELGALRWGQEAIAEVVRVEGGVLAIDDVNYLDNLSGAVLAQVIVSGSAFAILTCRDDQPLPPPVARLSNGSFLERYALGPLRREDVDELLETVLGDPLEGRTRRELWRLSGGNPLFLRELVYGAKEREILRRREGVWGHEGSLASSARIQEVLDSRLASLTTSEKRALELLALVEPIGLELVHQASDAGALEALERKKLIEVRRDGRRMFIRAVHPLYTEAMAASLPKTRAREVYGRIAIQLEGYGCRRRGDLLRLATWTVESGRQSDPAILIGAAQKARLLFDHALAERLAWRAVDLGGGPEATLLLAEAIGAQGRLDEAEELLSQVTDDAPTDAVLTHGVLALADLLVFHRGDPRILDILQQTATRVTDSNCRDDLEAMLVFAASYLGVQPRAIERGRQFLALEGRHPAAQVRVLVVYTYARGLMADYAGLDNEINQGLDLAERYPEAFPIAVHLLLVNRGFALRGRGRFVEAEKLARELYERSLKEDVRDLQGLWATQLAHSLDMRGHAKEANRLYEEAIVALRQQDPVGMSLLVLALASYSAALVGDRQRCRELLSEYERQAIGRVPAFGTAWEARARSWLLYLEGDLAGAAEQARNAGETAIKENLLAFAAQYLHDAVRFGYPDQVIEQLTALRSKTEGELIPLLTAQGEALSEGDPSQLEVLANRFEEIGADLYAAEAAGQAAFLHKRHGSSRRYRRARANMSWLAERCSGVVTPWHWSERSQELTSREFEVAAMAARGLSNREIGTRLYISPRTVGNHLASVYTKLGAAGRHELADFIGLAVPTESATEWGHP